MQMYELTDFGVSVLVEDGGGQLIGTLQEEHPENETMDECAEIDAYNRMMDGIESMILAHACEGIDITSEAYFNGLKTAIDACANNC